MKILRTFIIFLFIPLAAISQEKVNSGENKGKIQAEVFGDYHYKANGSLSDDSLFSGGEYQRYDKGDHGIAFRRFNFGYEHSFSEKFDARIMLEGNDAFVTADNARTVYIKYALLGWNISELHRLIIGAQPTPTFSTFSERYWGYRSIEKTISDFRRDASSNDVGIALTGNFNSDKSLGYYVMLGNGSSTKIETNRFKRLYTSVHGTASNISWQIYFDYEGAADNVNRYMFKLFAAYNKDRFSAGIEPYTRRTYSNGDLQKNTFGTAFYARGFFNEKLGAFTRVDLYDPELNDQNWYKEVFVILGLDYNPVKGVSIMPNLWINGYNSENSLFPERNADVVPRITFWFKI